MDAREAEAVLESCPSFALEIVTAAEAESAAAAVVTPTAGSAHEQQSGQQVEGDPLELYDDNGNGRFMCIEARRHGILPVRSNHPAYQYMRDPDGDGVVCE